MLEPSEVMQWVVGRTSPPLQHPPLLSGTAQGVAYVQPTNTPANRDPDRMGLHFTPENSRRPSGWTGFCGATR